MHYIHSHCCVTITTLSLQNSFSSFQSETLYPLSNISPFSLPPVLETTNLLSVSMNLTTLGSSYEWNTLATSWEELTHWKRLWCWEELGAGGEGDNRGWDGWMASMTWWTWVWVNSRSWWWTRRPGMLQFMGSQRVGHDWVSEVNWMLGNKPFQNSVTYNNYLFLLTCP